MIKHTCYNFDDIHITAQVSEYASTGATAEYHAMLSVSHSRTTFDQQFSNLAEGLNRLINNRAFVNACIVFKRYFLSDIANQYQLIKENEKNNASVVQQTPLGGGKIALWVYLTTGGTTTHIDNHTSTIERNGYRHIYTTGLISGGKESGNQTTSIFDTYKRSLTLFNANIKNECIRTWLYVQNVDVNYAGMVKSRTAFFAAEGLNKDTHYIASTGIEGRHILPETLVMMDAYAIAGISQTQIKHLHAPSHLNNTYEYGVTFERGTAIDFADRRHIYISGTASISNKGEVLYPNNIVKQTLRTMENIAALLAEAGAALQDVMQMIIYLRDITEYPTIAKFFTEHYRHTPKVIVWAPVCRPSWLIEVECIAIKQISNQELRPF